MAKHVIEEQLLNTAGFNIVSNGEVQIASPNVDRILILQSDGTIDIDIADNKLKFSVKVPVFTTKQW